MISAVLWIVVGVGKKETIVCFFYYQYGALSQLSTSGKMILSFLPFVKLIEINFYLENSYCASLCISVWFLLVSILKQRNIQQWIVCIKNFPPVRILGNVKFGYFNFHKNSHFCRRKTFHLNISCYFLKRELSF